ncbi:hypothetical protein GCM10027180_32710 [Microbulbifer echini]
MVEGLPLVGGEESLDGSDIDGQMNGHSLLLAFLLDRNTKPGLAQKQLRFYRGSVPKQIEVNYAQGS